MSFHAHISRRVLLRRSVYGFLRISCIYRACIGRIYRTVEPRETRGSVEEWHHDAWFNLFAELGLRARVSALWWQSRRGPNTFSHEGLASLLPNDGFAELSNTSAIMEDDEDTLDTQRIAEIRMLVCNAALSRALAHHPGLPQRSPRAYPAFMHSLCTSHRSVGAGRARYMTWREKLPLTNPFLLFTADFESSSAAARRVASA